MEAPDNESTAWEKARHITTVYWENAWYRLGDTVTLSGRYGRVVALYRRPAWENKGCPVIKICMLDTQSDEWAPASRVQKGRKQ